MYGGYIDSDFVLQNSRCWQVIFNQGEELLGLEILDVF
jgi:hypothetical protein